MLTNKTLNANVDPSAIGGTYTWSAESCTCVTACNDVSFTSTTGTVVSTNFSTTVTYPDDCTSIIIKLTIITVEGEEQCVSTFFYNIVNELGGSQLTWSCESNEVGCTQIPSQNQIFETEYDCLNCTTCPCSTSNVCQDATFQAAYDCDTYELTITSANQIDWCTVPYPVIETVNIVLNHTQGNYTHTETVNLPCNTALPLVIDLTANPLPAGVYFVDIIVQLNGCQVLVNSLFVNCPTGGGDVYNIDCCIGQITGSAHVDQQNNPPVVYTYHFNTPLTQDIIIDLDTAQIVDKLSVYSTWNNASLTGTEIATTNYIGHCGECCNTQYHPYTVGYFERNYNGVTPTPPVDSPHRTCNNGTYTGGTTPVPGGFSYGGYLDFGKARLVLTPTYVNSLGLIDNILYIVMYNNGTANTYDEFGNLTCSCNTVWSFRVKCDDNCPCGETGAPEIVILPKVCEVSSGELIIVTPCLSLTGHMQWSLDGITWIEGEPMYIALPGITGVTQTLYTRCISDTDYSCYSDITQTTFSKPDCCSGLLDFTVECNPITEGLYNQTGYKYRVIYYIPSCDDTENPDIVSPLYGSPEDNDYQYIVGFNDNAVTVEVYFNETSPYFFSIACNICQTPMYWASNSDDIQNAISNLLINHACEPCDIELDPRFDLGSSSFYISLDNDFGTADFPSIPQGQPPYTLTITKNGILTIAGITVSYNGTILNTGPIYLTTTLMPNLSGEYTIVGYYPVVPGAPPVRNTNINYGFFLTLANPGQYVINITDHDGCIAETTVCNIAAELSSCTANVLYAVLSGIIHSTQTFEDIIIDGITYASGGIVFNVNPAITKAAILAFLNTIPIVGASFAVDIVTNLAETQMLVITYLNCDAVTSLEFNTSSPTLSSSVFVFEEPIVNTTWTVNIVPAFTITSYAWSLGDDLVLISGTLTDSTITTAGGGSLSVQVTTEECDQITTDACIPTVDIVSCAVEYAQVTTLHMPGGNALNYYFKGLVANGINISSANIQLVGSGVTAAAVVESNILNFINTNLRPYVGGIFSVNYTNTLSTSALDIKWYNCEGEIVDLQGRFNESNNVTTHHGPVVTTTVSEPSTNILTLDYSPNVPITSYTWTLDGPTLAIGELTDSIIAIHGGGNIDVEVEGLNCGTATDTICIASITDFDTVCATVDSVTSTTTVAVTGDLFRGVEIGGTPYAGASITLHDAFIISNTSLEISITAWLDTNVVPTVGGYFTVVVDNSSSPMSVTVTWTGCDTLLNSLQLVMEDTLLAPYYGSLDNTPTTIPDLFLIEALVEPAGTLSNEDWFATGAMVVEYVVSETQAYVLYGGAGTLTYSVDVDACGHANRTYTQV